MCSPKLFQGIPRIPRSAHLPRTNTSNCLALGKEFSTELQWPRTQTNQTRHLLAVGENAGALRLRGKAKDSGAKTFGGCTTHVGQPGASGSFLAEKRTRKQVLPSLPTWKLPEGHCSKSSKGVLECLGAMLPWRVITAYHSHQPPDRCLAPHCGSRRPARRGQRGGPRHGARASGWAGQRLPGAPTHRSPT